jgi:hypothetical protein
VTARATSIIVIDPVSIGAGCAGDARVRVSQLSLGLSPSTEPQAPQAQEGEQMTTQQRGGSKAAATKIVTTNTGRILRVSADEVTSSIAAKTATAAPQPVIDPARRADVLFRVRRDEGHELSAWWMIGAFVVTSGLVILLLSGVPGIA